jgi:hypothetical protein
VAQLGARFHGMEEVVGSIPTRSTNNPFNTNYLQALANRPLIVSRVLKGAEIFNLQWQHQFNDS